MLPTRFLWYFGTVRSLKNPLKRPFPLGSDRKIPTHQQKFIEWQLNKLRPSQSTFMQQKLLHWMHA
jgi:hypothetical protein